MDKPKQYTRNDVEELIKWFDDHKQEIPQSLKVSRSTNIPDLKKTIEYLKTIALNYYSNSNYVGYIVRLEEIRTRIQGGNVN